MVALCEGTCTQLKAVGVGHIKEDGGLLEVEVHEGGRGGGEEVHGAGGGEG